MREVDFSLVSRSRAGSNLQGDQATKITSIAAAAALSLVAGAVSAAELRLSHQWSTKDVRHKVAQSGDNLFLKAVAAISRFAGRCSAGMIVAAVAITCQMIFIRFVLNGSTI